MNYTKLIVATTCGNVQVMTGEMRQLMKEGIKRNLVPLKEFKKPPLKLTNEAKQEISSCKRNIRQILWEISKLEKKKSQYGISKSEIAAIEAEVENCQFKIFEQQVNIRNIKKNCYKNQTSGLDLEV